MCKISNRSVMFKYIIDVLAILNTYNFYILYLLVINTNKVKWR
jgi:hypothetical protein